MGEVSETAHVQIEEIILVIQTLVVCQASVVALKEVGKIVLYFGVKRFGD